MNISDIRRAGQLMKEANAILSGGPLDYYLTELAAAHDLLMTRFAPFKVGDRVELAVTPVINEKTRWGWMGCKHFLIKGAAGTVASSSCGTKGFRFGIIFDEESWISPLDKSVNPTSEPHEFWFGEGSLRGAK
jgi:hypothetical protein